MHKATWLKGLLILAILFQPLSARTDSRPSKDKEKQKREYPPPSLFRKEPAEPKNFGYWNPEIHGRQEAYRTGPDGARQFLAEECGRNPVKLSEGEKVLVSADDLFGKVCWGVAVLGALG